MIERGLGRTEHTEIGGFEREARPLLEAADRDVRPPDLPFTGRDLELLEAPEEIEPEPPVVHDDVVLAGLGLVSWAKVHHPDTRSLVVAGGLKHVRNRLGRGRPKLGRDELDIRGGAASEKRERDVEVLRWHDPKSVPPGEALPLPGDDSPARFLGKLEATEEP
jgi:hypothetical protein